MTPSIIYDQGGLEEEDFDDHRPDDDHRHDHDDEDHGGGDDDHDHDYHQGGRDAGSELFLSCLVASC